jgi:hypothetical protein
MTHALFGERNVVVVQLGDFKAVERPVEEVAEKLVSLCGYFCVKLSFGSGHTIGPALQGDDE